MWTYSIAYFEYLAKISYLARQKDTISFLKDSSKSNLAKGMFFSLSVLFNEHVKKCPLNLMKLYKNMEWYTVRTVSILLRVCNEVSKNVVIVVPQ